MKHIFTSIKGVLCIYSADLYPHMPKLALFDLQDLRPLQLAILELETVGTINQGSKEDAK